MLVNRNLVFFYFSGKICPDIVAQIVAYELLLADYTKQVLPVSH